MATFTFVDTMKRRGINIFSSGNLCHLAILMSLMTFVACEKDISTTTDTAYFGGEIINPKNDRVILSKSGKGIDTLRLDKNNRFIYKMNDLQPGLYTFELVAGDANELQMVLIEPGDSIMFRLNTLEFDESLVYTGKGAKKNNFLIEMFLDGENEERALLGFSQLPPRDFEEKVDSMRKDKIKKLKQFDDSNTPSELFDEIAKVNINYAYYLSKEVYPFANYSKSEKKIIESLPKDFYDFRKDVNYNYTLVEGYFPYYYFLKRHFENMALTKHFKHSKDSVFNRKCAGYSTTRLNLIDSLIQEPSIKDPLLLRATMEFISNNKNVGDYDELLQSFLAKSSNEDHKHYVSNVINSLKELKPGNYLPNIAVYNTKGEEVDLKNVGGNGQPKVLYFWSNAYMNYFQDCHKKAKELKVKYPEVNFLAINTSFHDVNTWEQVLKKYKTNTDNEYLFKNVAQAQKRLAIYPMNKVMIIDKDGKIINPHTNMFSYDFEEQLLGMLNQ
ncbi:redoxin domain-containing protein [Mangrovimonas sp. AS39]|uniref:TlpA family protein disulfide reductase n=1 Tax=Mangrovimonas futianensis TaxID=2895523 RepID=UPI001E4D5778|nr:redoxin domain-containing protein [Mangrovimonas futianensis]MCF1196411.1 redoxin domain-containing protein [Mangrovimonas futianensis]